MAYPTDLWVYPRWETLTPEMLFWPVWPISPTMPHYVTLGQLATYINPGAGNIDPGFILGNPTAAPAPAIPTSLSSIIDRSISATQGSILYRSATAWVALSPSTNNYVLTTSGAAANPRWADVTSLPGVGGYPIVSTSDTPPPSPTDGMLWWDSVGGQLYVWYDDSTSAQWVAATNEEGSAGSGGGSTLPSGISYDQLIFLGGSWAGYRPRYIASCFVPGVMQSSQYLLVHKVSKAVTFPANFGSYMGHTSQSQGTANATASTVVDIRKSTAATPGTFSSVGTITIAAGAMTGTFATSGGTAVTFAQGDAIALVGPGTADTTFTNFAATLVGYES